MKTFKTLALMLVVFLFTLTLAQAASKQPDYMYLGRQEEKLGHYRAAANYYSSAAEGIENYGKKAELIANEVVRMFAISSTIRETLSTMLTVRKYVDHKKANALLAKHEKLVRKQLADYVSRNRAWGFPDEDQRNEAINYFHQFYPQSREVLAEEKYKNAVAENSGYWYDLAAATSDKVAAKIVNHFLGDVSKLTIQQKAQQLKIAGKYITDFKVREKYANELLPEGKRLAVIPDKTGEKTYENRTSEIREALIVLMGQGWVDDINRLPAVRVLGFGEHIVEVQPGEQTPYWVMFTSERPTDTDLYSTKGSDYIRVYENGDIVDKNGTYHGNLSKFKIVAKQYSKIKLEVK